MQRTKTFYFLLLWVMPLLSMSQNAVPGNFKIYSTSKKMLISIDDIINDMAKTDVLFFGEEHNDSTGHLLEYQLLQKLAESYPGKTALSMEMFQTDCQTILNEYLAALIKEKNLHEDARLWPNYPDYRPMIEYAKDNHLPVIAANAPTRYTNLVTRLGLQSIKLLDAAGQSWLPPLPIDTATGTYLKKFDSVMGGHNAMPGMHIYQSQNLWDATMGWSVAKFLKANAGYKILHLNGGFHSEEKLGVVSQLKKYAPTLRVLNIATYADDNFNHPDWNKFTRFGDYILLTDLKPVKISN